MRQALAGVLVVDLSRYLPGPYCTMLLADLGARVIKVEDAAGDPARAMGPPADPQAFARLLNRGKEGLALDLRSQAGREALGRLVARADVLVEGFRPGVLAGLGLDPATLAGRFPRLVVASVSGFGQDGPHRDRPGHDLTYQALAGVLDLNGPADAPAMPGAQLADASGGLFAALGVVAALFERERTGRGQHLDVALAEAALAANPLAAAAAIAGAPVRRARGPLHGALARYQVYRCADGGSFALGALEDKFWRAFAEAVDRPDWLAREAQQDQRALATQVAEVFATRSRDDWASFFEARGLCGEPVLSVSEALAHPQTLARGIGGPALPDPLVRPTPVARGPALGEHTAAILAELGYDPAEVATLTPVPARAGAPAP